ncbi:hypothetical protein B0H63DRAFT_467138 [Podospora didyma]|uniref:RNA-binding protein n=1 Tax=Podospora didyma TaxID=330526 RepID=A0AAE0P0H7_9PEZI|nr:hypothetical protein B0H63DRAFT_467138 [Podospora didyma]
MSLVPEETRDDLRKWIVKRLENTSDADADVLADYVLALLQHDGSTEEVRMLCETQLPDFLKEDAHTFVNDVFGVIASQSYLPVALQRPPPRREPPHPLVTAQFHAQQFLPAGGLSYDDLPVPQVPPPLSGAPYQNQNGSRKRPFNDQGVIADAQIGRDDRFNDGRSFKQARRGRGGSVGRGGRGDDGNGFATSQVPAATFSQMGNQPQLPHFTPTDLTNPALNPNSPHFDPAAAMEAFFKLQQQIQMAGGMIPDYSALARGGPHAGGARAQVRRQQRCRDYDSKGYCARGATCMFVHGDNVPFAQEPTSFVQPDTQPPLDEEYDPSDALMTGIFNRPMPIPLQQTFAPGGHHQPRQKGGKQQQPAKRRKAHFSADGPVFDRAKSTIVVENIPEENFSEDQVRDYFSQFGNVVEISMQPYKRLALVKFEHWGQANAAWKSPKSVFENRFVKIFWYNDDETVLPTSMPLNGGVASGLKQSGSVTGQSVTGAGSPAPPEIDMEELMRKQAEAQRIYEEKTRKLQEVELQRQEIEKRQQELLAKQRLEKARLAAKLAKKSQGSGVTGGNGESTSDSTKPVNQTEALRAQLAMLEDEAKQLGLDPDAMSETSSTWNPRGGSFVRGRGAPGYYRARGFAPRGARGGAFRGGRGNHHAAYAAYSLDNRPKKVVLTGVDFTVPEKDETLRQYLFGIGEFTDIQTSPSSAEITFKDRKTAEKLFNGLALNNNEIPGLDGQVEPSWSAGGASSVSLGSTPAASNSGTPGGTVTSSFSKTWPAGGQVNHNTKNNAMKHHQNLPPPSDDNTVMGNGSDDKDVNIILERSTHQDHADMDYDVADDNQWDNGWDVE